MIPEVQSVESKKGEPFKQGIQSGVSIAIGYMPIALTYGLLAKATGLSLFETLAMSLFVFAGASQFIALNLIAVSAGAFEMIFTTFLVNLRHMLMTATIGERAESDPKWMKALYAYGVTDETFAVAATRGGKLSAFYMFGLNLTAYMSWVTFSGVGYVAGASLPQTLQESMGIALYAMFIGLLVPSLKKAGKFVVLASTAALLNSLFTLFHVSAGWGIVLSTLLAATSVECFYRLGRKNQGGKVVE